MNSNTIKDAYPLPRIDESLDQLSDSSLFSTLNLCSGYWQVEIDQEDKTKTVFATRRGLFQFACHAIWFMLRPSNIQTPNGKRFGRTSLGHILRLFRQHYCDRQDICRNYLNLRKVFDRLKGAGCKLKAIKCCLFAKKVTYLEHVVSEKGVARNSAKTAAVEHCKSLRMSLKYAIFGGYVVTIGDS